MILLLRLVAFLIDYLILMVYALALLGIVLLWGVDHHISSPVIAQLAGFASLTLPVILYFTVLEHGKRQASVGKRVMRLIVTDPTHQAASFKRLLVRNLLKFLPWEIAHLGIHWAYYYSRLGLELPAWIWIPLILSQMLAIGYVLSIVLHSNHQALYEQWSGTRVIDVTRDEPGCKKREI